MLSAKNLHAIADEGVNLYRHARCIARKTYVASTDPLWKALENHGMSTTPAQRNTAVERIRDASIRMVHAPTNASHWHWVRNDGDLFRVHHNLGESNRFIDPAEDLAAAAVEFGLTRDQVSHVITRYEQCTGDELSMARYQLGLLRHTARSLDELSIVDAMGAELFGTSAISNADTRRLGLHAAGARVLDGLNA